MSASRYLLKKMLTLFQSKIWFTFIVVCCEHRSKNFKENNTLCTLRIILLTTYQGYNKGTQKSLENIFRYLQLSGNDDGPIIDVNIVNI